MTSGHHAINVFIDKDTHTLLKVWCAANNLTMKEAINRALCDFVKAKGITSAPEYIKKNNPISENVFINEELMQMRLYREEVERNAILDGTPVPEYIKAFTNDMDGLKAYTDFWEDQKRKLEEQRKKQRANLPTTKEMQKIYSLNKAD